MKPPKTTFDLVFWFRWTTLCAVGEILGISVAAGAAMADSFYFGEPYLLSHKLRTLFIMVAAGMLEGVITGGLQVFALKKKAPRLNGLRWVGLTGLAAALCWTAGMAPSLFFLSDGGGDFSEPTQAPSFLLAMAAFAGAGALFGFAQWLELRRHAAPAVLWIPANALGWAAGLGIVYQAASYPDLDTPLNVVIGLAALSGLGAGLVVGMATGAAAAVLRWHSPQ